MYFVLKILNFFFNFHYSALHVVYKICHYVHFIVTTNYLCGTYKPHK